MNTTPYRDDPFIQVAQDLDSVSIHLTLAQDHALRSLKGVSWDFSRLQVLVQRMASLLRAQLPLRAYREYLEFSVSGPGVLLAKRRRKKPPHLAQHWGRTAGKKTSGRKLAAVKLNLERARAARQRKREGLPAAAQKAQTEIKALRRLLRRLKYREARDGLARAASPRKRAPRRDSDRRAKRIAEIQQQVREMEAKWPHLRTGPQRVASIPDPRQQLFFQSLLGGDSVPERSGAQQT